MILLLEESVLTAGPAPCEAKIRETETAGDLHIRAGNLRR
jgi:hypothetical protein